jgi:hypothetical protein
MNYYTVVDIRSINLCPIENAIFNWKLKNLATYINNLTYINDNNILFSVSIYNKIYDFKLKYNINWIVETSLDIDTNNIFQPTLV